MQIKSFAHSEHLQKWFPFFFFLKGTSAQNCDFESSVCNYKQDKTDNFDWRWYHGATDTKSTGPAKDHTPKSNKGEY